MLWIWIGFNADQDQDPAIYDNVDPDTDPDPWSQINADPGGSGDPDKTFESQKVEFFTWKNFLQVVGKRSKNIATKVQKPFGKAENQVYL
jgi:hypothetical protein